MSVGRILMVVRACLGKSGGEAAILFPDYFHIETKVSESKEREMYDI